MNFRSIMGKIHLWLGLGSGLLVFIIAITGCLYAFQEEIQNATQTFRFVDKQDGSYLPPSKLLEIAQKELPGKLIHSVLYKEKHKSAEVIFWHYEPNYYYSVYLNPYNGAVLKVKNNMDGFFRFVLNGHFYLWLPPDIGQPVVASATLIFVLLILTGLILWFPKNIYLLKQSIMFVWRKNTHWRRKNFDLHNILGYYASFLALIIALTGLVWGFQWFANSAYKLSGGQKSLVYENPASDTIRISSQIHPIPPIDMVWQWMSRTYPHAASIEVHPPEDDFSSIAANANLEEGTYWKTDYRYFDRYSLKEMTVNHIYGKLDDANMADKLLRMNYDIHTGSIAGIAGKIIVFLIGLIVASLPVTGFIIWYKRKK